MLRMWRRECGCGYQDGEGSGGFVGLLENEWLFEMEVEIREWGW